LEARLLLAHASGVTPASLLRDQSLPIVIEGFGSLVARRVDHEPLALILGRREFWSLDFEVSSDTLIPRPDSETLVEAALAAFADRTPPRRVLDLGTGTGCLLLAALSEFPAAFGIGIDCSAAAAALAARNAASLRLSDRAAFVCADWMQAVRGQFDLILCNPPYIPTCELAGLMSEVARFEPRRALDGGPDGLASYRVLLPDLQRSLTPEGVAVLELGVGQAEQVAGEARKCGLSATVRRDLSGIARAIALCSASP
jgi:release factor glutamine methyltransferase